VEHPLYYGNDVLKIEMKGGQINFIARTRTVCCSAAYGLKTWGENQLPDL